jgi:long-chain acyl-CoA synthetase
MGEKLTFRDLDLLSNQLAQCLLKLGLKPDDVVGMHMPNIPAHYLGLIAVQKAGCVSTGLSPLLTPHEMEHQLTDSRAKVVMTADVLFEKVEKVAEVAGKTPFSTVIVAEIADFLPGVKRVLGKLLKKIPTAPIRPLPGKTVLKFNVPTVFFELLKVPEFKALDLSNLNFCLSAAAPFPAEYIAEMEKIIGGGISSNSTA